jgi:hypothetical protein
LSPGKLADFVILSTYSLDDFVAAEGSVSIEAAYVGGVQAYPWNPIILERIMCSIENRHVRENSFSHICLIASVVCLTSPSPVFRRALTDNFTPGITNFLR